MDNLLIGHLTDEEKGTGLSAFLFKKGATAACLICGSAPASHELAVLDPGNSVPHLHGLLFSGGSAFGLAASAGVMRYLREQEIGHPTLAGPVPIVPAACIYDLNYKTAIAPSAEQAYQACIKAVADNKERGRIGAGTGARVGKIIPHAHSMHGGVGVAQLSLENGVVVSAYVVVNCVGDVYDQTGKIVAGAKLQGAFADCNAYLLSGKAEKDLFTQSNSTLVAVITNAKFAKDELLRINKMAISGIARAVSPVFTRYDGDIAFAISVGNKNASELTVGTMAAQAVRLAIINAVTS